MRPRHLLLAAFLAIVLGGVAYVVLREPAPADRAGTPSPAVLEPSSDSSERLVPGELEGVAEDSSRAPISPADTPRGESAPSAPEEAGEGIAVRGRVRFADDAAPAAGLDFVLSHSGGPLLVEADEAGRFATAAVLAPGLVRVRHRKTEQDGRYPQRLRFDPDTLWLSAAEGDEVEVELTLLVPEHELVVTVVHPGGRPVPGAEVQLESRSEPRPGEFSHLADGVTTGDDGRASFAMFEIEQLREVGLFARRVEPTVNGGTRYLVSEVLMLELPLRPEASPTTLRLALDTAGTLLVRVVDSSAAAVPSQRVWVASQGPMLASRTETNPITDDFGEAWIEGLPPGEYRLGLIGGPGAPAHVATVYAGRLSEVELVRSGSDRPLAVAGRVVDEEGAPLAGVQINVVYGPRAGPGDTSASGKTDAEGRFEFHAEPCDGLIVRSDRDIFGDEFTPSTQEVSFGSTDVLFRRLRAVPRRKVSFEIVDAVTGERLKGSLVMTYRAPYLGEYSFHRADELASPLCSLHPGTTLVIDAPGYRRATVLLADLLREETADGLLRVALERGLLRRLLVEGDDSNGNAGPVEGAQVLDDGRLLGFTDGAGEIELDLLTWPEGGLTIRADGFAVATWMPIDSQAELEAAWVWLERTESQQSATPSDR